MADFWLFLYTLGGIGSRRILSLQTRFGKDPDVHEVVFHLGKNFRVLSGTEIQNWRHTVSKTKEKLDSMSISVIPAWSNEYPGLLGEIPDKPAFLFVMGDVSALSFEKLVTVVGTRSMSEYGRNVLDEIVRPLVSRGVSIVSGLAVGVDAMAHRIVCETAEVGGNPDRRRVALPIAVLPGGPKDGYPLANRELFQKVAGHGAVVWEFLPGAPISRNMFAVRNRILSGLSRCTIVVESGEKGGSLITAQTALDYNREVGAVPGSIFSEVSGGTNRLISEGAHVITSWWDVMMLLDGECGICSRDGKNKSVLGGVVADVLSAIRCPASKYSEATRVLLSSGMDIPSLNYYSALDEAGIHRVLTRLELEGILRRNHEGKIKLSGRVT